RFLRSRCKALGLGYCASKLAPKRVRGEIPISWINSESSPHDVLDAVGDRDVEARERWPVFRINRLFSTRIIGCSRIRLASCNDFEDDKCEGVDVGPRTCRAEHWLKLFGRTVR